MAIDAKTKILVAYSKLAKKLKRYPTRADLKKQNISRDMLRNHFGNLEGLKQAAKEKYPNSFEGIIEPENFDDSVHSDLVKKCKGYKKFFVTTAVAGAPVDQDFLASIKKWCELKNALLLIIPANYALYDIEPDLVNDPDVNIVFKTLRLNSNIAIDPIKIDPKQVDPVVGLDAIGKREGTVIIGSPKQRRIGIANSNEKLARMIQSTGAITKPRYMPTDGVPKRRDRLAEEHHVMGGVIVEMVDNKLYHFRNVEMCKDGSFHDAFYNYSEDGEAFEGCEAIIQGDLHVTETDPVVDAVVDEMCRIGKPKYRILHDVLSAVSINHHEMKNKVKRAILAREGKIDLRTELKANKDVLEAKLKLKTAKHIVMVKSNHDEFLDRYLAEGNFDDQNREISTELQLLAMRGLDPYKDGLEIIFGLKKTKDLIWLGRDQDFKIAGVECGSHGDLGSNGRRNPGSKGMYKAYGKAMYGHCHHSEIWHDAMSVGTSTYMKLGYNRGASSWDNGQGILYKNGTRQLILVINGEWHT